MKIFLLCLFFVACATAKVRYDGFKVYRVTPETTQHIKTLQSIDNIIKKLDFWSDVTVIGRPVDVMVPPFGQKRFERILSMKGMKTEMLIEDVQKKIDQESSVNTIPRAGERVEMNWTSYFNLENINAWLDELAAANPSTVSTIVGGSSYEGRDIKGIKISFKSGQRAVYIEGGIHAREWISPATSTYLINELLNSQDPVFRRIAESFDWYILPVVNPDGYIHSHTTTRLWRKNRQPFTLCTGVDLNRNWDVYWGTEGTSSLACEETYGGRNGFSEKETSTLSEFLTSIGSNLDVFISFHSYGQMMLMPYGHTTDHLDNYDDVLKVGQAAAAALAVRYNTTYAVGNTAETIYKHSGGTMDWVKKTLQVPIAFTFELRDKGANGFVLPANQIIPNGLEVVDGLVALFTEGDNINLITLG